MATRKRISEEYKTDLEIIIQNIKSVYLSALQSLGIFNAIGMRNEIIYGDPVDIKSRDLPCFTVRLDNINAQTNYKGGVSSNVPMTFNIICKIVFSTVDDQTDLLDKDSASSELYRFFLQNVREINKGVAGLEPELMPLDPEYDKKRIDGNIAFVYVSNFSIRVTPTYRILR